MTDRTSHLARTLLTYAQEIADSDEQSPGWRRAARDLALDRATECGLSADDARALVAEAALSAVGA